MDGCMGGSGESSALSASSAGILSGFRGAGAFLLGIGAMLLVVGNFTGGGLGIAGLKELRRVSLDGSTFVVVAAALRITGGCDNVLAAEGRRTFVPF